MDDFPWWFIVLIIIAVIWGIVEFAAIMGSDLDPWVKYMLLTR